MGGRVDLEDVPPVVLRTKYGIQEFPSKNVDVVLSGRILRVIGDRRFMSSCGMYETPFLVLNRDQEVFHRYSDPRTALRAVEHARRGEGVSDDQITDGDRQKVLAWLSQHQALLIWLAEGVMRSSDRERFNRACGDLAESMGRPINEVKQLILERTMTAAATQDGNAAAEVLEEAIGFDQKRLGQIQGIGVGLNWRDAVIVREIVEQQRMLHDVAVSIELIVAEREGLLGKMAGRTEHLHRIGEQIMKLDGAKDRPFRGLAQRCIGDLMLYRSECIEGSFRDAGKYLKKCAVALRCVTYSYEIDGIMHRLAMASGARGARRDDMLGKAQADLAALKARMHPEEGDVLDRNPLWGALGSVNDALAIWRSDAPDLDEIKDRLRGAVKRFG